MRDLGFTDLGLQQTQAYPDASRLYEWRSEAVADDKLEIDQLVARFFGAFDNRAGRIPTVAALPCWLMPRASIHRIAQANDVEEIDVRSFVEPRAHLLASGELREFHE